MTDINEKKALERAIMRRVDATCLSDRQSAWQDIRDAIVALDNAAYDRAYGRAREQAEDWHQVAIDREQAAIDGALKIDQLKQERDALQGQLQTQVPALRQLRDEAEADVARSDKELANAHETIRAQSAHLARVNEAHAQELANARAEHVDAFDEMADWQADALNLRKALETLAGRYHAQLCYKNRRYPHRRGSCPYVLAVQDANEALDASGGAVSGGEVRLFPGKIDNVVTVNRALTADDVKSLARELAGLGSALSSDIGDLDGRVRTLEGKPQEEPEIEAVLMGSQIKCACGCDWIIEVGHVAYRFAKPTWASLYVSPEHVREAARRTEREQS